MTTRRQFMVMGAATPLVVAFSAKAASPAGSRPMPTPEQVAWHDAEIGMFFHWDIHVQRHTVDGKPRALPEGATNVPASFFNPERLDTDQWMEAVKALGAKYAILTAKHGSGFMHWQSNAYDYGMRQAAYRDGRGDVVKMFVESCRKAGIKPGLYLSFDNNHYMRVGRFKAKDAEALANYKRVCVQMASEVWGNYGDLFEIWIDGGLPPKEWDLDLRPLIERYQPRTIVFGADKVRHPLTWAENEEGFARYPAWSVRNGIWCPTECPVPLQRHYKWFWTPGCQAFNRSYEELVAMYYHTVGRNANLLLGATPGPDGAIPQHDIDLYTAVGKGINARFGKPIGTVSGEGDSVTLTLPTVSEVNQMSVREDIGRGGERIRAYLVEGHMPDGAWMPLCAGTSVGHCRIDMFEKTAVSALRFTALRSDDKPLIRDFKAYYVDDWRPVIV